MSNVATEFCKAFWGGSAYAEMLPSARRKLSHRLGVAQSIQPRHERIAQSDRKFERCDVSARKTQNALTFSNSKYGACRYIALRRAVSVHRLAAVADDRGTGREPQLVVELSRTPCV